MSRTHDDFHMTDAELAAIRAGREATAGLLLLVVLIAMAAFVAIGTLSRLTDRAPVEPAELRAPNAATR